MNSLNILSGLGSTPPPSPPRSRTASASNIYDTSRRSTDEDGSVSTLDTDAVAKKLEGEAQEPEEASKEQQDEPGDEKTPLLEGTASDTSKDRQRSQAWQIPKRVADAIANSLTIVFTAITAPGRYVIACFYDDQGHFSAILPLRKLDRLFSRRRRKSTARAVGLSSAPETDAQDEKPKAQKRNSTRRSPSVDSTATSASSDSEAEKEKTDDSPARNTRSKTAPREADEIAPAKKSIRIRLGSDEALRKRKQQKLQQKKQEAAANTKENEDQVAAVASSLKSPSSPTSLSKITRYPRAPAPPRPLVPRRQPSYVMTYTPDAPKKTLIIDLDETLIHSMAKGGRMSTGHMVEVRLGGAVSSGGMSIGSGVPILYYVHERPHCHEFLRKVSAGCCQSDGSTAYRTIRFASGSIWSSLQPRCKSMRIRSSTG